MTKTVRDNCDINIVQQTSCEPPFPDVQMQLKTYFIVPFLRPCMHHNYGVISGSHTCRDCVWHIILDAELYTTCPGERVLVATRFNATFLPLRLCYENTRICFSKDAESLTTYGCVLWCNQIVCICPYSLKTIIMAGLTIGQTRQMPRASRFWGPRAWIWKHCFTGFLMFSGC